MIGPAHATRGSRRHALVLVLATVILVAGCGGGGGGGGGGGTTGAPSFPPVPADFTTYQGAGYRFAYPQDWQRGSKTGALGEAIVTVLSGPRTDGVHCYGFASRKDNYSSDLTAAVRSLLDVTGDKTQQILQNKEVHVADARQGILVERTYDLTDRGTGKATPVHLFEVHYLTKAGAAVAFTIGGPQADVDACHVREIFDSFQLSS